MHATEDPAQAPEKLPVRPAGAGKPAPPAVQPWLPAPTRPANGAAGPQPAPRPDRPALPQVRPSADLPAIRPKPRWIALCFALTFLVYLACIPRILLFSNPPTGDQAFYLMVTASIVEDHDLNVANNYEQRDEDKFYSLAPHPDGFVGMGAPYPLNQLLAFSTARPPEEHYDFRMPGLPVLVTPGWIAGSFFNLWWPGTLVVMCLLGALVGLNIFLLGYELTGRLWIAWLVWLPLAFSNPIMSYALVLFTELPTALFTLYAFRRLARGWGANRPIQLLLTGVCIGYIPWMSWRCLPIAASLGLYGLIQWLRGLRAGRRPARDGAAPLDVPGRTDPRVSWAILLLPVALSAMLLIGFDLFLYGTLTPPNKVPELGDTAPFLWPWESAANWTHFVTTGFALLLDRQMGLLPYAPIYALAIVGILAMVRSIRPSDRRLALGLAVVALPYIGLIMTYVLWNGLWNPPSRFLTAITPLLAAPLALSLAALVRSRLYQGLYVLFALPGLFLMGLMLNDARLLWPANPVFGWLAGAPDWPVKFDVRPFLPAFSPLDDLHLPANTGWLTAALVGLGLLGWGLLARQGRTVRARHWPAPAQALCCAGLIALAGAGWLTMNGDYLKHRTLLVQQQHWPIGALNQPLGIAYLDGRIFLTDFRGHGVGTLDTATGEYHGLPAHGTDGPIPYGQPGDIKVGPDHLLWLLNNGPGGRALLVMQPDGTVVRQIPLAEKSDVAVGLSFGPDGKLYVADMIGGRVRIYAPSGGEPLTNLGETPDGFNNVSGVTVAADGTVYAADVGLHRVVAIAPDGHFAHTYNVGCAAWYMVSKDDWLDVSCDRGLVSINTRTGAIQGTRVAEPAPQLAAPTGLTYGPDGLLYVLDTDSVSAYQVQH